MRVAKSDRFCQSGGRVLALPNRRRVASQVDHRGNQPDLPILYVFTASAIDPISREGGEPCANGADKCLICQVVETQIIAPGAFAIT